ncbi:DNA-3-methyladenine glycosylase family protein [Staphylococcus simiae]|uniref:DNA-3-methyladenine glycosylase II n=1 Tax=Staphylococcus simiae CCM 7213 = CCUG 51256 TaxID=911238 RepID=G5JHY0_9STAP|nr:DNA-3-methyladenine glycosylase [Staphylococcus simiae]EHJ08173.1 DNA-3-methyladenine glycosylase II [Staphylococcus simiae CCM 7213 = CCUG 51256]PNZ14295.1 DNA-3-methyladenine glycosylase 2 family protein [Staphylococcus simiae]SNV81526.1 DNA-3-methyladenine glycosylase [Staphylococcus simiae]
MSDIKEGYIFPKQPFDFNKSVAFLKGFKPADDEQDITKQSLTKGVQIAHQNFVFTLKSIGSIDAPKLAYTLYSEEDINDKVEQHVVARLRFFLSMDDDLEHFYKLGNKDPLFKPILDDLYGYHQVKFLSAFENACWAILSTRAPMPLAKKMKQNFAKAFGGQIAYNNKSYIAFPQATSIKHISVEDIEQVIHNHQKATYLKNVIDFFAHENGFDLAQGDYDAVKDKLLTIKGIGKWSATFIMLRGLGFMEHLPDNEKVLNDKIQALYQSTSIDIQSVINYYGDAKGYWVHYIRAYDALKS